MKMTQQGSSEGRYAYVHGGNKVYEWSQDLDSVSIFLRPPPPVPGNLIYVEIRAGEVTAGLKGADTGPFIKEETGGLVDVGESTWVMDGEGEGREIEIVLNPGFDFRNAEFNGQVPDARNFMGGVGYS
ncbi:hypothetical protein TrRE_jg11090 [Triparma retinervis]|uniref:CS domain-containing protein n=1 Tax=Triparma retinervis TaxID=2557542 RepID=A0A9W7E8S0_9STRA|nr:hypothetical protein TrRE_jg11090 [Triparma retinervis]